MAEQRPVAQVVASAGEAELAADALWAAGASAVGVEDLGDGTVRLTGDVTDLGAVPARWSAEVVDVDPAEGLDAWREFARPVRAGRRLVLQPAWLPVEAGPGDVVILLDPGRAFGSGSHPTTRLVLAVLEEHLRGGEWVLDVGCGSGVLSIGACLLGAASAEGVDIDPAAVAATQDNAERNGVADRVRASTTPLSEIAGTFDVVVANIGMRVLGELHDDIVSQARASALVVLAGLLDDQADAAAATYADCTEVDRRSEDGWTVLALRT